MLGSGIERVEPDGAPRPQSHRPHAPRRGQVPVLTLGIHHPGPATEDGLAPQEGLDERALAPADLPEDHHVGVGHHTLGVELEGVEDEGSTEEVVTDHHPSLAQPGLGNEGIGRPQIAGGDLVGGHSRSDRARHAKERSAARRPVPRLGAWPGAWLGACPGSGVGGRHPS